MTNQFRIYVCFVVCCTLTMGGAFSQVALFPVAISGQAAPDLPEPLVYRTFDLDSLCLNDSGEIAFYCTIRGVGVRPDPNSAVFKGTLRDGIRLVASEGQQVPGLPADVEIDIVPGPLSISQSGMTTFLCSLSGLAGPTTDLAILSEGRGFGPYAIAREGGQAPGFSNGVTYEGFGYKPIVNSRGETMYLAYLDGDNASDAALYIDAPSTGPNILAKVFGEIDGLPGVRYSVLPDWFFFNDMGHAAFHAILTGAGVTGSNNDAIVSNGGWGDLRVSSRTGDQVPGLQAGVVIEDIFFSSLRFNNADDIVFRADMDGPGVTSDNNRAIFQKQVESELNIVVREGDPVLGLDSGVVFAGLGRPEVNDLGQIVSYASLAGPGIDTSNNAGLFAYFDGGTVIKSIARKGEPAPGFSGNVSFSTVLPLRDTFHINNADQITFLSILNGDNGEFRGLFATKLDGELRKVVAEGETIDLDRNPLNSDLRTIDRIFDWTDFNDDGDLLFLLEFADDSLAVIIADTRSAFPCLADINNDGILSPTDFTAWIKAFNYNLPECDQNGDDACTPADFSAWVNNYNTGC